MANLLKLSSVAALATAATRWLRNRRRIDFTRKSVVVTGGSRGLGLEMARLLAKEGAYLTLMARDADELARAEEDVQRYTDHVQTVTCDVADTDDVRQAVEQAMDAYGRVDVLINNAASMIVSPEAHVTRQDIEDALATNFWGAYNMMEAVVPIMEKQGKGRIVNISSMGGLLALPHLLPYSVSKFAMRGYSDSMRMSLSEKGIRVTTVFPGMVRTGSHVNVQIKGQHEKEFSWFSIGNAFPPISVDSGDAARRIIEACRYGDAHLTFPWFARLAEITEGVAPGLMASTMKAINTLLPGSAPSGDTAQRGYESTSALSPSVATRPSDRNVERNNERLQYPPKRGPQRTADESKRSTDG